MFKGELAFSSLAILPLRFQKDPDGIKEILLNRGRRFCQLSMMERNYMNYKGSMHMRTFHALGFEENAVGRNMNDLGSFS